MFEVWLLCLHSMVPESMVISMLIGLCNWTNPYGDLFDRDF
jgi:hypothetical protein